MRALAVIAVMVYHTNNGWLPGGFIGVEVFFVISGYLITLLLIGEHEKTGRDRPQAVLDAPTPPAVAGAVLDDGAADDLPAIFKRETLGKLRGDVIAGVGLRHQLVPDLGRRRLHRLLDFAPLRHLWSLAVEEQFYLFWPMIMVGLMLLGRRRLPEISRWLVLAAVAHRRRDGAALPPGPARHPGGRTPRPTGRSVGTRSSKMDTLYLSTITTGDRAAARRRLSHALAAGGGDARTAAQQGAAARCPRRHRARSPSARWRGTSTCRSTAKPIRGCSTAGSSPSPSPPCW